jgi:HEAT repeat protein
MIFTALVPIASTAGDLPVPGVDFIRKMLLLPDADFSIFIGSELCDALMYLIENDEYERVVHHAVGRLWETGDERSVPYLIDYLDEYPLDCLYSLGYFSTPESRNTLLAHLGDEDEFNRRFAAQSLGKLDFTVSEEMWELRDGALTALQERLGKEEEEWILPILNDAILAINAQVFPQDGPGMAD